MKVVITRPGAGGSDFAALVQTAGGAPILSPVAEIEFRRAEADLEGIGALAFTSANGVRAFAIVSRERRLPVFAVGPATAAAADAAGFSTVKIAGSDVESLASAIIAGRPKGGLLHPSGRERAGDLVEALQKVGISARRLVLYEARPLLALAPGARAALAEGGAAVAFFSPRSARLFLRQVRRASLKSRLADAVALSLSRAVDARSAPATWRERRVAREPSAQAMAELVAALVVDERSRAL